MLKDYKTRIQSRWVQLSLRQQLILILWLCTIPISAIGSAAVWRQAYVQEKYAISRSTAFSMATLAQVMNNWLNNNQAYLQQLAGEPSIDSMDPSSVQAQLNRARASYPAMELTVYKSNGIPIASNAKVPPRATATDTQRRLQSIWFTEALTGKPGIELWLRSVTKTTCLSQSTAIAQNNKTVGILQACIPPEYVAAQSGVATRLKMSETGGSTTQRLNLSGGSNKGFAILLVSKDGELLRLDEQGAAVTENGTLVKAALVAKGPWGPIVRSINGLALSRDNSGQTEDHGYLIAASRLNREFRLASVTDKGTAFAEIRQVTLGILFTNLLALLISTLAIARITKPLLSPVDAAGEALRKLSEGDFAIALPSPPNSNIKRLYSYINASTTQLQAYVANVAKNAVNNAQISEAKHLQTGFLVKDLPRNQDAELAAICIPAYDIGADWYDALELTGGPGSQTDQQQRPITAIVVADVCDKGIPSALYMSVFRSLLRMSLQQEWQTHRDPAASLGAALNVVNRYMAVTHGDTCMFATAFVGAYVPDQGQLTYILAGHEPPFIRRAGKPASDPQLERLQLSGPALGLFQGATFQVHCCPFHPGDLLLAYSDGLPDARDGAGVALGITAIEHLLGNLDPMTCTAEACLEQILAVVNQHCGLHEHFDDLTLLSLRAVGGS